MFGRKLRKAASEEEENSQKEEELQKEKISVKDRFAMTFSAFLVIFLPCLAILLGLGLLILFLFGAL